MPSRRKRWDYLRFNEKRRTAAAPSILSTFGFPRSGMAWSQGILKPTPANLRRFGETPGAEGDQHDQGSDCGHEVASAGAAGRALQDFRWSGERSVLTENLEQPNPDDSFRSLAEQVLEDVIVGGFRRDRGGGVAMRSGGRRYGRWMARPSA